MFLNWLGLLISRVRCAGSAALGLAYVAQGMWDAYHTEGLKPWDVAAGVLIVTEAGGHVLDSLGKTSHTYRKI